MRSDEGSKISIFGEGQTPKKEQKENEVKMEGKEENENKIGSSSLLKKKSQVFTKKEIGTFLFFTAVLIYIVSDELRIEQQIFLFYGSY